MSYKADYRQLNDCIDNLVYNPYASPDYIFQQIEQLRMCIKSYTGKNVHLNSCLQQFVTTYKSLAGKSINDEWVNSISKYMQSRDSLVKQNNYCYRDEDEDDFICEDLANKCWVIMSLNMYDETQLMDNVRYSQQVAPWSIDDVPPKITFSVGSFIAGCVLIASGTGEIIIVGRILQSLGLCMAIEHSASTCQKQYDDKQQKKKKEKGYVDIRKPYQPEGAVDIRQRHLGQ